MRNEKQRQWHDYMTIYTPTEERPIRVDGIDFTSIRSLMKWLREELPLREWKAIKFKAYITNCHQIKYTRDKNDVVAEPRSVVMWGTSE